MTPAGHRGLATCLQGDEMVASDRSQPGPDSPGAERQRALARLARALAGVLYARRPGLAPPMVVRSVTIAGLRREIERAEQQRELRP